MQIEQVSCGAKVHLPLIQALVCREKIVSGNGGWVAGQKTGKRWGFGLEFAEIRNYVAGDEVRHINWRASSRSQRLMTKVFVEDNDARALVLVDLMRHMYFGTSKRLCSVMAVYFAAMLASRLLARSLHVAICWINTNKAMMSKPTNNRSLVIKRLLQMGQSHNNQLCDLAHQQQNHIDRLESHIRPELFRPYSHTFIVSSPYGSLHQLDSPAVKSKVHNLQIYDPQLLKQRTRFRNFSNNETSIGADELTEIDTASDNFFPCNLELVEIRSRLDKLLGRAI